LKKKLEGIIVKTNGISEVRHIPKCRPRLIPKKTSVIFARIVRPEVHRKGHYRTPMDGPKVISTIVESRRGNALHQYFSPPLGLLVILVVKPQALVLFVFGTMIQSTRDKEIMILQICPTRSPRALPT
jgi:hypothetical protein